MKWIRNVAFCSFFDAIRDPVLDEEDKGTLVALDVSEEKLLEVRKELSENPSGWKVKQIMNIIYERTGVRYHEVHVYRLLHKWRF
ncbi:MAG: winged helix-turn-helix domain-containing protein, partial [Candidatus Nitrosopolaris sp.]